MEDQSKPEVVKSGTWADFMNESAPEETNSQEQESESAQAETTETVATPAAETQTAPAQETVTPPAAAATTPEVVTQPPVETDWKTVLSKVDRKEALKVLGLDDFDIDLVEYRRTTGDVTPFLEVKTKDWNKISDEEVVRHDLRKKYTGLSDEEFALIYRDEVIDRYNLDRETYDENDIKAKTGAVKLKFEANQIRQREIAEQAKFRAPERQDNSAEIERQRQAEIDQHNQFLTQHAATQALITNKRLVLGSGDHKFNYEISSPQEVLGMITNPEKYQQYFTQPNGQPDVEKLLFLTAAAKDPNGLVKSLIDYGISLGNKQTIDKELHNIPDKTGTPPPSSEPANLQQAFLKGNVVKGTFGG